MTYKTHILGGILAGLVASKMGITEGLANETTVVVVSTFASLIPDIDIKGSKISNKAKAVSKVATSLSGHRGIFHTPILYIILAFLLRNILPQVIIVGFLAGVFSHILLDMFNRKGVPILYPIITKKISLASIGTRGTGETIVSVVLMGLIAIVFLDIDILGMVRNIDYTTEIKSVIAEADISETKMTIVNKGMGIYSIVKEVIKERLVDIIGMVR